MHKEDILICTFQNNLWAYKSSLYGERGAAHTTVALLDVFNPNTVTKSDVPCTLYRYIMLGRGICEKIPVERRKITRAE